MSALRFHTVLNWPKLALADHYPELRPLYKAVTRRDWPAIELFFQQLPPQHDPTVAIAMVAEMRGSEGFLRGQSSVLARTMLGARLVFLAWEARGAYYAKNTSRERFRRFHEILGEAEVVLADVTAEDPGNIAAWTGRIRIARGLQLGLAEARRRYEHAAAARPNPFSAQLTMLQQLCPKWGGSIQLMHSFAKECAQQAPLGALNAAAVAEAHIEHSRIDGEASGYWKRPGVVDDLAEAVTRSVDDPAYRPIHGWVQAHSSFAYAWMVAGRKREASEHFAALNGRVTDYPWEYIGNARGNYIVRRIGAPLLG